MSLSIRHNVPLAPLTTFKIGGCAQSYVEVTTVDQVREAVVWAHDNGVKFVVMSGGSNLLVCDAGFAGLVIRLVEGDVAWAQEELTAEAGCNLLSLITDASERGYGGWEKLAGIPGTLGGAIRGNAGAFGVEIKDFAVVVSAINVESYEVRDFLNDECDFSYRSSFFKKHPQWIVVKISVRLAPVEHDASKQAVAETIAERERRHLQNVQAAGSYFMNPVAPAHVVHMFEQEKNVISRESRVPAGWLIEKVGMKGARVGDAQASFQHPNYLVNLGAATATDVQTLALGIKQAVRDAFDVDLQEEASHIQ